jgi:hypothetical protein
MKLNCVIFRVNPTYMTNLIFLRVLKCKFDLGKDCTVAGSERGSACLCSPWDKDSPISLNRNHFHLAEGKCIIRYYSRHQITLNILVHSSSYIARFIRFSEYGLDDRRNSVRLQTGTNDIYVPTEFGGMR